MESQQDYRPKVSERKRTTRKKFYIFLFCFITSAFVWSIIKLSDEYPEVHTCYVEYTNVPPGKVLISQSDTVLTLNLKSKGFRILSYSLFSESQKISLDISTVLHKKKNSKDEYYIFTRELNNAVGAQINHQDDVITISPDTLFFSMADNYSRKVPVKSMLNISFAQQYGLSDSVVIYPDCVIVNGPKEIIDSIQSVSTVSQSISNVNLSTAVILKFPENNKNLIIRPKSVNAYVFVDKYTESKVEVPVVISGSEMKNTIKTFPEKITVTYLVPVSKFKKIDADKFTATADISKAKSVNAKKLKVEITRMPSFVKILKIEPEKIEYILLKQ